MIIFLFYTILFLIAIFRRVIIGHTGMIDISRLILTCFT